MVVAKACIKVKVRYTLNYVKSVYEVWDYSETDRLSNFHFLHWEWMTLADFSPLMWLVKLQSLCKPGREVYSSESDDTYADVFIQYSETSVAFMQAKFTFQVLIYEVGSVHRDKSVLWMCPGFVTCGKWLHLGTVVIIIKNRVQVFHLFGQSVWLDLCMQHRSVLLLTMNMALCMGIYIILYILVDRCLHTYTLWVLSTDNMLAVFVVG